MDGDDDYFDPTRGEADPNLVVRELESGALGDFDVLDQVWSLGHGETLPVASVAYSLTTPPFRSLACPNGRRFIVPSPWRSKRSANTFRVRLPP